MIGGAREKVMKQMVNKMIHGESGDIVTGLIAAKEIDLLCKVNRLHGSLGIDEIDRIPAKEDRKDQIKGLIEALVADDVPAFWFDQAGRERLTNADDAREFLDLEADEWTDKIDRIVRSYRRQGDERPESAIVADYVNRKFDVELHWFVSHVVNWTPEQKRNVASAILLGNFNAVGSGIDLAIDRLDEGVTDAPDE